MSDKADKLRAARNKLLDELDKADRGYRNMLVSSFMSGEQDTRSDTFKKATVVINARAALIEGELQILKDQISEILTWAVDNPSNN